MKKKLFSLQNLLSSTWKIGKDTIRKPIERATKWCITHFRTRFLAREIDKSLATFSNQKRTLGFFQSLSISEKNPAMTPNFYFIFGAARPLGTYIGNIFSYLMGSQISIFHFSNVIFTLQKSSNSKNNHTSRSARFENICMKKKFIKNDQVKRKIRRKAEVTFFMRALLFVWSDFSVSVLYFSVCH